MGDVQYCIDVYHLPLHYPKNFFNQYYPRNQNNFLSYLVMTPSSRFLTSILISSIYFIGCEQKQTNSDKTGSEPQKEKHRIDSSDFKITDTVNLDGIIGNYETAVDTSYFYDLADSGTKRSEYLPKDEMVLVYKVSNGFGYADRQMLSGKNMLGWLLLHDLTQIFFTPPKVVKE